VVSHQTSKTLKAEPPQMPSAVERMEPRNGQLLGVANVMEIRRRHENVGIFRR
jgi:hypothetical protein